MVISYECRVGRLIEIQIASPFDLLQASKLAASAASLFSSKPDMRFVSVVDMRGLLVLAPNIADDMLVNLKRANRRIERTGVLLPTSPTLALQVERLHREAGNPARKTFREADALRTFLASALTDEEQLELARFLT